MKPKETLSDRLARPSTSTSKINPGMNTRTKRSSCGVPAGNMQNVVSKSEPKSKKRKREDFAANGRSESSDLEVSEEQRVQENCDGRAKLKAKRITCTERTKDSQLGEKSKCKDTPQMQQLRQKLLQRQAAGNAPRRSKILSPNQAKKETPVKGEVTSSEANNTESMTPQMRAIFEKIKQKEANGGSSKGARRRTIATSSKIVSPERPGTSSTEEHENREKYVRRSISQPMKQRSVRPERGVRKNLAQERLAKLQKSFTEEPNAVDNSPGEPENLVHDAGCADASKESLMSTSCSIYKNADVRAKLLRDRLENKMLFEKKTSLRSAAETAGNLNDEEGSKIPLVDSFYEDMDWEPIEDEKIMKEIQVVRLHIGTIQDEDCTTEVPPKSLDLPDGQFQKEQKPSLYIVLDTNVFLSNLPAVEEAREAVFKNYGPPLIVVPWTVIRELDFIKDDKSMSRPEGLRAKARQAVRFLHAHFSARHPRILAQNPYDVANNKEKFHSECPDDEILQTCLQIRSSGHNVVLLSYDKNLCNKAMIHDLVILGRNDPLEKVDYLFASDARNESFLSLHLQGIEQNPETLPPHVKELRSVEVFLEEAKEIVSSFITVIVTRELQNLYNNDWVKYAYIIPPWSVYAALKCAIKHWIAVVSDSFERRGEPLLKELLQSLNSMTDDGRKLTDVSHILELITDILQCVKEEKYPNLVAEAMRAVMNLKKKVAETAEQLRRQKIEDSWEARMYAREQQERADRAFRQFEQVYAFTRDVCGLASNEIGMPCGFTFKRLEPEPTRSEIKEMQPEVAANLNRLLQILGTALEEIDRSCVDNKSVEALYHALSNFMPERRGSVPEEFDPLDVYWCLKKKGKEVKLGLTQLQELSTHFCRMASFRCT